MTKDTAQFDPYSYQHVQWPWLLECVVWILWYSFGCSSNSHFQILYLSVIPFTKCKLATLWHEQRK